MTCGVCSKEIETGKEGRGYGKIVCSDECFTLAGQGYKPNMDRNRGGGVGKGRVSI